MKQRRLAALLYFVVGMACCSPGFVGLYCVATVAEPGKPRDTAGLQQPQSRDGLLAIGLGIAGWLLGGAAIGAAAGVALGEVRFWPTLGTVLSVPGFLGLWIMAHDWSVGQRAPPELRCFILALTVLVAAGSVAVITVSMRQQRNAS